MVRKLVIVGEYNPAWETHRFTNAALEHAQQALALSLDVAWCSTQAITRRVLAEANGFWLATGTPYKNMHQALAVIRYAREHNIPCLGTCQGFQHIMLDYAQSFLGLENPGHAEYDPTFEKPFITELSCSLKGQEAVVNILDGSLAFDYYRSSQTIEKFYCSYGINPAYTPRVNHGLMRISGTDINGEIRIVEYRDHPFLIGTLFVPQAHSRAEDPHPLVTAFIRAIGRIA